MAGRPRNEALDDRIHQTTLALLAEVGYEKVSLAEVARRSGTAITTLYRRYPNGRELIIGSLRAEFASLQIALDDTGSLVGDLKACVRQIATSLNPLRGAVLTGLILPMRDDPALGEIIRSELDVLGRDQWQQLVQRAIGRGELPAQTVASELLAFVVPSVIFQCVMVQRIELDQANILDELVYFVLLPALKGQVLVAHE